MQVSQFLCFNLLTYRVLGNKKSDSHDGYVFVFKHNSFMYLYCNVYMPVCQFARNVKYRLLDSILCYLIYSFPRALDTNLRTQIICKEHYNALVIKCS